MSVKEITQKQNTDGVPKYMEGFAQTWIEWCNNDYGRGGGGGGGKLIFPLARQVYMES